MITQEKIIDNLNSLIAITVTKNFPIRNGQDQMAALANSTNI